MGNPDGGFQVCLTQGNVHISFQQPGLGVGLGVKSLTYADMKFRKPVGAGSEGNLSCQQTQKIEIMIF